MRISQRLNATIHTPPCSPSESPFRHISVRLASCPEEYATAFRIAYHVYYALGYTPFSAIGMRTSPYQFKSSTVIFLAYHDGRAVACLSLFEDDERGLPSDGGWPLSLDKLRIQRKQIFEIGSLMVLPDCPLRGPGICLALFRHAWMYARSLRGADSLCAFVQSRHALFYKKMLNFTSFVPTRNYQWNQLKIPDVSPLEMNLDTAEENFKRLFNRFGNSPRNLYHHFVIEGRTETEQHLRRNVTIKNALDLQALRQQFQPESHSLAGKSAQRTRPLSVSTITSPPQE